MDNIGQITISTPVWPVIVGLIYVTLLGQLIPTENLNTLEMIGIVISVIVVIFVFGMVIPNDIILYLKSRVKK